jgi:dipeptidyl aminopeptidase/acylaminoacyl peptidase
VPGTHRLILVRGGADDNSTGVNPNPGRERVAAPRRIFVVDADAATAPQLYAAGKYPKPSPDGKAIAFVTGDGLVVAPVSDGSKPAVVVDKPVDSDYAWSPDAKRIAFTDDRGTYAFVGIAGVAPGSGPVTYARAEFANDSRPVWSPDGTRIAFLRLPALGDPLVDVAIANGPWSVQIADAQTGATHTLFRVAKRGPGFSFFWTDAFPSGPIWWLASNTIVFPAETDGYLHLYAADPDGRTAPRLLTPGRFEIETAVPTADNRALLVQSNQDDLVARHLWRLDPLRGNSVRLTSGPRNQWSPVALAGNAYAYVDAGYDEPPAMVVHDSADRALAASAITAPARAAFVRPRVVTFRSADGLTIHGELFAPRGAPARHPALIFVHGGPVRQMLPGFHYFEAYTQLYEFNQYFANHGFTVLSIDYRSGIMYGAAFRDAAHIGPAGAAEYQDVLAGAAFLKRQPGVDPHELGIYGLSYGGYLTALALARNSDLFAAGADFAGVHDWAGILGGPALSGVATPQELRTAWEASPLSSVAQWRSPVFLSQGDDDRNVKFDQGLRLADALRKRGVEVDELVIPDETHAYTRYADLLASYEAAAQFLIAHLHGTP